jgi:hypothetical protein
VLWLLLVLFWQCEGDVGVARERKKRKLRKSAVAQHMPQEKQVAFLAKDVFGESLSASMKS